MTRQCSSHTALPLEWKTHVPVWVEQWPLPQEKLIALKELVQEQLTEGHIEPTTSPYNTPVFVIKKKSGRWRLLHDLRAINKIMEPMGALQCGTPNPNVIPHDYQLAVIDLKDCFFSIPLLPRDRKYFAFTIPVLNNSQPTERYHWKVLPQGMLNSPTLCQYYVNQSLLPFRKRYPMLKVYHYMDDILIAGPELPPSWKTDLQNMLQEYGLQIAPEKVQCIEPFLYLGHKMMAAYSIPIIPQIALKTNINYVTLQQVLGIINWVRPYYRLDTNMLSPLFDVLRQGRHPSDIISLTKTQLDAIEQVNQSLAKVWVDRAVDNEPPRLACLQGVTQPCAALFQAPEAGTVRILEWLYLAHTPANTLTPLPSMLASLITKGRQRAWVLLGIDPVEIVLPIPLHLWQTLCETNPEVQCACSAFTGVFSCHTLKDPRFSMTQRLPLNFCYLLSPTPLPDVLTVFTDGSPHRGVLSWRDPSTTHWCSLFTLPQSSAQRAELAAVILAFNRFSMQPFNIITDSLYVANVVSNISGSYVSPALDKNLLALFLALQHLIHSRTDQFFYCSYSKPPTIPWHVDRRQCPGGCPT